MPYIVILVILEHLVETLTNQTLNYQQRIFAVDYKQLATATVTLHIKSLPQQSHDDDTVHIRNLALFCTGGEN